MIEHYHPLDLYGDESPPGIDAIATISAGWKESRKDGGMAMPHVSRDGQIIIHDAGGRAPGLAAALAAGESKRLTIAFPLDDPAVFIQERYVAYSATNLLAYGDDSQITTIDPKTGERQVLQAGTPQYEAAKANCKVARSVYFVLAEWTEQGPEIVFPDGLGYYRLRFTSRNSMRSIRATIASVSRFTRGHIAGIPFTLSLDYRDLADGKGARHNAPVWTILMQPPQGMRLSSKSFAQIAQGALAEGQALMLPAPGQETLDVALIEAPEPDLDEIEIIEAGGRCDYDHWIRAWHQAVKDTQYATDLGRANFLLLYTGSRTNSLAEFLEGATEKEAAELVAAVLKEIAPEPQPPSPPTPRSPEEVQKDIKDLFGPQGFPKDQPAEDAEAPEIDAEFDSSGARERVAQKRAERVAAQPSSAGVDDLPLPEPMPESQDGGEPGSPGRDKSVPDLMSYPPAQALNDLRLIAANLSLKDGGMEASPSWMTTLAERLLPYLGNPTPFYIAAWGHATLTRAEAKATADWLKAFEPSKGREAIKGSIEGIIAKTTVEGRVG